MKKRYNYIFILSIILLLTMGIISGYNSWSNKDNEYIKENGEKISQSFRDIYDDDDKIINNTGSIYVYTYNNNCWSSERKEGEYKVFNGIRPLWTLDLKEDSEITLDYNTELEKGRFKVLLVTPDKKIEEILENTSKNTDEKEEIKINVKQGENIIYMVGDLANIKFDFSIEVPDFLEVTNSTKIK